MPQITIYATPTCPYCIRAKSLLERKGVTYREINVDLDPEVRAEMEHLSGRTSVPQIFIDEFHVGGYDDMVALDMDDDLDHRIGI
ncbi:MAG: glutaredoxin 3 [Gammaproteobacteria bacterium]|nr:glutaredoxin 3 [Gammaproteobacteria bacterium]